MQGRSKGLARLTGGGPTKATLSRSPANTLQDALNTETSRDPMSKLDGSVADKTFSLFGKSQLEHRKSNGEVEDVEKNRATLVGSRDANSPSPENLPMVSPVSVATTGDNGAFTFSIAFLSFSEAPSLSATSFSVEDSQDACSNAAHHAPSPSQHHSRCQSFRDFLCYLPHLMRLRAWWSRHRGHALRDRSTL